MNRNRRRPEPIQVEKRVTPADVVQVLGSIYDVSNKSWKSGQGRAITSSPEAIRLFEALSRRLAEKGWVTLWLASVGEQPVAFEYHLTYAGVTCPIRADFDEAYREISPGAYLEADVLRSVFEDSESGLAEYNSCGDSYEYLLHWSKIAREHATLRIAAPSWYGRILHILGGLRRPRRSRAEVVDAEHTS